MYDRKILIENTIRLLIERGTLSEFELCELLGVSRGTVRGVLGALEGILRRDSDGYSFVDELVGIMLRVGVEGASIRAYSPSRGILEDRELPFSFAISHDDNLSFAFATVGSYKKALESKGYRVYCCFIYDKCDGAPYRLPGMICASESIEDLVARSIVAKVPDSCLFISKVNLLCCGGMGITQAVVTPKDIGVFIESYLKYARPDRIIIESEPSESVSMVCAKLGARCSRMEKIMGSYTYERAMLAKGIATCENNKK